MQYRFFYITLIVIYLLGFFSCKSPTETEKKNTPPDSTTQNFTFETYLFGDGFTSSFLNDSWIIDENNIWVCGNVFTYDSLDGNMMQWNGTRWKGIRKEYVDLKGLWGIGNKLFLASGGLWIFENGTLIRQIIDPPLTNHQLIYYLWGSSESNIWGVGPNGGLVHYDGTKWMAINFDNQWQFYGITGSKSSAVAYALARNDKNTTIIVSLKSSSVDIIYNSSEYLPQYEGWTLTMANEKEIYVAFGDIWKFNIETKKTELIYHSNDNTTIASSCTVSQNDIYFYGTNVTSQMLIHYNGKRFKKFELPLPGDIIKGIRAIDNLAVAVGFTNNKASIIKIKRNL